MSSCGLPTGLQHHRSPRTRALIHFLQSGLIPALTLTVLLLGAGTLFAATTAAQAVYGSIAGTVIDASGGVVADAKVTITDTGRNVVYTTTTNSSGAFVQSHLIIGIYKVQIEAPGFKTVSEEKVEVAVDTVHTVDVTMQPGDVRQTIEVSDVTPLLKTERTDVATMLSDRQVTELPSFGRNFSELLLYTPGAVQFNWNDTSTENPQGGIAVNVNGQEFVGVGAFLDGTDNRDMMYGNMIIVPDLDAVVQAKVTSANYNAEFGQVSAAVVTTSTKSGTNQFHGGVSWYRRTDATQARDPFAQAPDPNDPHKRLIPTTHWNQVVGTIGGPIKKDKAFFFVDYQGTRAKDGGSAQARVPTEAERNGDFSAWLAQGVVIYNPYDALGNIANPLNRTPYPNNQVPVSSVATNLLKNVPLPNVVPDRVDGLNYSAGFSDTYNADLLTARVDYFYSDKLRFFDRYTYTQFFKSAPGLFGPIGGGPQLNPVGYTGTGDTRPQSNSFGLDYTIKPTLLADFRFGFYRQRIFVNPLALGSFASDAGAPGLNIPGDPTTNSMPHFNIQGDGNFDFGNGLYNNCNCPLIEVMQQFQYVTNWTWIKGNHTFKFGPDIRRLQNLRVPSDQHRSGEIAFTPQLTEHEFIDPVNGPQFEGGLGVASFMLGEVSSFQRYVSNSLDAGERQWRTFYYGEDTWKATSKLTVNYGLRWEIYYPQTVTGKDKGGWLDIHTGEMLVAGENGVPLSGPVKNSFKNLAPRLGIAYQLTPKTVIRMGYGRSFDVGMFGSIFGHSVTQNLPVLGTQSDQPSNNWDHVFNLAVGPDPLDPATVLDSQPLGPNGNHLFPNGIRAWIYPDKMRLPTVDAWNATIQRQITPTFSLEAAYVGNKGTHIFVGEGPSFDINVPNQDEFLTKSTDERRPFGQQVNGAFGWTVPMPCFCNLGNNKYNALQIKAEKRFSHGLQVLGHYTYSHAKNNDGPYFLWDHNLFYGRPDWQRNHTIVAATIYELPFGRGKRFLHDVSKPLDYIVGGWQLSNATTWMSGQGFNVGYNNCGNDNDAGVCWPNLVGNPYPSHRTVAEWYIPASNILANGETSGPWQRPQPGQFGDAGRNRLVGPRWFDSDLSVFKTVPIREQLRAQFRAEIYNVFNHANLGNPNGCVDCGIGGQILNLAPNATMRRMQFALRLEF